MKLICPHCRRNFDLEQAVREMEHREMADIAAQFGQSWKLVYEYSDCFRQSEWGDVSDRKRLRIFRDLLSLFEVKRFKFEGKTYRTTWQEVLAAMTETCNAGKWGFRNHNYLKVLLKKSAQRESAEGMTAEEEHTRETGKRKGEPARKPPGLPESGLTDYSARKHITDIIRGLEEKRKCET